MQAELEGLPCHTITNKLQASLAAQLGGTATTVEVPLGRAGCPPKHTLRMALWQSGAPVLHSRAHTTRQCYRHC